MLLHLNILFNFTAVELSIRTSLCLEDIIHLLLTCFIRFLYFHFTIISEYLEPMQSLSASKLIDLVWDTTFPVETCETTSFLTLPFVT